MRHVDASCDYYNGRLFNCIRRRETVFQEQPLEIVADKGRRMTSVPDVDSEDLFRAGYDSGIRKVVSCLIHME